MFSHRTFSTFSKQPLFNLLRDWDNTSNLPSWSFYSNEKMLGLVHTGARKVVHLMMASCPPGLMIEGCPLLWWTLDHHFPKNQLPKVMIETCPLWENNVGNLSTLMLECCPLFHLINLAVNKVNGMNVWKFGREYDCFIKWMVNIIAVFILFVTAFF